MISSSRIAYSVNTQCLIAHSWQVIACDIDIYSAALLLNFETHYNDKYIIDKYCKNVAAVAAMHGKSRILNENILITLKLRDLRKTHFDLAAEKKNSLKHIQTIQSTGLSWCSYHTGIIHD